MRRESSPHLHDRSRPAGTRSRIAPAGRTSPGPCKCCAATHAPHAPSRISRRLYRHHASIYEPLPHPTAENTAPRTTSPTLRPRPRRGLLAAWRTDVPTYESLPRFTTDLDRLTTDLDRLTTDLDRLTPAQRRRFRRTVAAFVDDLRTGRPFRPGLRIKGVRRTPGVYELTWSMGTGPAGRATFERSRGAPRHTARHLAPHRHPRHPDWALTAASHAEGPAPPRVREGLTPISGAVPGGSARAQVLPACGQHDPSGAPRPPWTARPSRAARSPNPAVPR